MVEIGEDKQKLSGNKQTFEQIPLTFPGFTGKILYGIMYGMLGSMVPHPFHLYPAFCRASVLRLMAFCFYYLPFGSLYAYN